MSKDLYMKDFNGEKIFSLEYDKETLKDMVLDLQNQLQQKENNIKEVREYIENNISGRNDGHFHCNFDGSVFDILEILDKENQDDKN